jgi:hypothetical protein
MPSYHTFESAAIAACNVCGIQPEECGCICKTWNLVFKEVKRLGDCLFFRPYISVV